MKRNVLKSLLMLCFSLISFLNLSGQNTQGNDSVVNPIYFDDAYIFPQNPGPTDSVYLVYSYESSDACPDFYLVNDSVVKNSVYVSKLSILNQGQICAQVVTKFKTKLCLGVFNEKTDLFFGGNFVATIDPYACNMDKMGKVIFVTEKSSIIQDENSEDMYEIRDQVLSIGTIVKFYGTKIQCITTPCYNIVDCFTIVDFTDCVMDKKGVVVAGESECSNQLFVQEYSPISSKKMLYAIENNFTNENPVDSSSTSTNNGFINGTVFPVLNIGDEIQFGVKKAEIDSSLISLCPVEGVVSCYEILNAEPECIMDKKGIVVAGKNSCEGQLLIKELTPYLSTPKLYVFVPEGVVSDAGSFTSSIKVGDKVIFGSVSFNIDSIFIGLTDSTFMPPMQDCTIAGFATCYEIVESQPIESYSISGKAIAGNDVVKSGSALLFAKGFKKALNALPLNSDGTFVFDNLIKGEYTVYIIPDIEQYKNYLPTFYVNKVHYKRADFVSLNENINELSIQLRPFNRPIGKGKIYGNISYESTGLKDTVMAENSMNKVKVQLKMNYATYLPVLLYNTNDEPVDWTVTDENGNYAFENIAIDSYKVVTETAAAEAEIPVVLTVENAVVNADLMLKSSENSTALQSPKLDVVNMYPNPVLDMLTINLKDAQEVSIYNAMGQLTMQKQLNSGSNMLDMSEMSKGVYFVKIGNSQTKLIKK